MTSQTPIPVKKPVSLLLLALLIGLVLLSVPLVIGFFGRVHPAFDSFAHFRAHLALIMAAGGALLLFTQLRREAVMVTLLGLSAFATTVNWSGVAQQGTDHSDTVRYKLMQINLLQNNRDPKAVLQAVARNKPDIITYQEGSQQWQPWLKILEASYPYHHQCVGSSRGWGVGVLSRRPFTQDSAPVCSGNGVMATTLINLGGTNVLVSSLHQSWPWPFAQAEQFAMLRPALEAMDNPHAIPVIIAGDFNAVPWSYAVRRIEDASATRHLNGIGPTFLIDQLPNGLKKWIGLPIDNILVSATVAAHRAKTDIAAGSDHLPVIMDFSVPAPQSEPENQETPPDQPSVRI